MRRNHGVGLLLGFLVAHTFITFVSASDLLQDDIQTGEQNLEAERRSIKKEPRWSTLQTSPLEENWFLNEMPPPDNMAQEGSRESEEDTSVKQYGVECIQHSACNYFDDVLLVIKLNPVRLLWLDALLNFYGTAFRNIVFYSALRKDDTSTYKWLRIGGRRVFVRLLDDNYGFCDHATIADASARHKKKNFSGFIYLSDDVLMMFWKFIGQDKTSLWKQKPSLNPKSDTIDGATMKTIQELNRRHGFTISTKELLFAATSGCYYVPNNEKLLERFSFISSLLLKYRSYNEWGTPLLLSAIMEPSSKFPDLDKKVNVIMVRGKLVWGHKRILVKKMFNHAYIWYHPVRANGEAFLRLSLYLHQQENNNLGPRAEIVMTKLFDKGQCLNCATYPKGDRLMKGLLHDCVVASQSSINAFGDDGECRDASSAWPGFKDAGLIGGKVILPPGRQNRLSPLELKHEGFWNKNLTLYMYDTHYGAMNSTRHSGTLLSGFPTCCFEPKGKP